AGQTVAVTVRRNAVVGVVRPSSGAPPSAEFVTADTSASLPNAKVLRLPRLLPGSLLFAGHSYVDVGSVDEGQSGRGFFPGRLMSAFGLGPNRFRNLALSGTTARWHAYLTLQGHNPGEDLSSPHLARLGVGV